MQPLRSALKFISILLLAGLLATCTSPSRSPLNQNFAKSYHYIDSVRVRIIQKNRHPAEAQKTLDSAIAVAQSKSDKLLVYELKVSRIYTNEPGNKALLEQQVLDDIKEAERKGYPLVAADGYHILSEWVYNNGNKKQGVEYALLCHELTKNVPLKDFPPKVKNIYKLSLWYYYFQQYKKSIYYILELGKTDKGSLFELDGKCLNTLALAYRTIGRYDLAIHYLNLIYQHDPDGTYVTVRALAAGNIGGIYQLEGNYTEAIKWLNRELKLSRLGRGRDNFSCLNDYVSFADIYTNIGQKQRALTYLDSAKQLRPLIGDFNRLSYYFATYASILRTNGHYRQALVYTDSLMMLKDSVAASNNVSKVLAAEKYIAVLKQSAEMETLKHERQKSIWIRNYLIILISFVSVLALMLINRSKLKYKQKQLELENEKAKAEVKLSEYTSKLQERNQQLAQLKHELDELNNEDDIANKNALIRQLQQSTILTDEQWEDFRNVYEKVHSGFIQRLRDHYHDLTPSEIQYIVLAKLNMTNKEIANVLGIGANSVRNYKFRLRKKLNLTENDDLESIIRSM